MAADMENEPLRVVIALKRKQGPVRDVSFSTRHPDDVLRRMQEAISTNS